MAFRTGHTTTVPDVGTINRKTRTLTGKGRAPVGTRKIKAPKASEVPTVTTSPTGHVTTSGFPSPRAAVQAKQRSQAARRRVRRIERQQASALGFHRRSQQRATESLPKPSVAALAKRDAPMTTKTVISSKPLGGTIKKAVRPVPAERPPSYKPPKFQGVKTAGAPSLKELQVASSNGRLRTNRKGFVTTPAVRKATAGLRRANAVVKRSTGIQGPLAPEQKRFVKGVAKHTGESPRAVAAQALAEQSGSAAAGYEAAGEHNYLNIGPGQHFGSNREAIRETSKLLNTSSNYAGIRAARGKSPLAQVRAIGSSPWGTVQSTMEGTLPQVSVKRNPRAVKQLQAAKTQAKRLGIKTAAPDISRGQDPRFVYVRADASAAVQWAQHALGTAEGSAKQVRWAGEQGLSTSQPWCANFVSADLKRHGVPLPPNPNYVPSYESEWSGGHNIGTNLAKAKPGDLIAYSGDHIGIYRGSGKVISGNYGNEVAESAASEGPAPISAILRPNYKGGKIKVKAGTPIPGYTGGTSITSVPAGAEAVLASSTSFPATSKLPRLPKLTPNQKAHRTLKKLAQLGAGVSQPSPGGTEGKGAILKSLEATYGKKAA